MSDDHTGQDGGGLDFDRAEWTDAKPDGSRDGLSGSDPSPTEGAPLCGRCNVPLAGQYHLLGDQMLCERCQYEVREAGPPSNAVTRWMGAVALGTVAGALGSALWFGVTELTGYELGLVAIVVGFMVGAAVHIGSRGLGGIPYQLLAVFLTYTAIVMTYVPIVASEFMDSEELGLTSEAPADLDADATEVVVEEPLTDQERRLLSLVIAIPFSFAMPFLMGIDNAIGLLIIGFALYQAWKMNRRAQLELKGPFQLGEREAAVG